MSKLIFKLFISIKYCSFSFSSFFILLLYSILLFASDCNEFIKLFFSINSSSIFFNFSSYSKLVLFCALIILIKSSFSFISFDNFSFSLSFNSNSSFNFLLLLFNSSNCKFNSFIFSFNSNFSSLIFFSLSLNSSFNLDELSSFCSTSSIIFILLVLYKSVKLFSFSKAVLLSYLSLLSLTLKDILFSNINGLLLINSLYFFSILSIDFNLSFNNSILNLFSLLSFINFIMFSLKNSLFSNFIVEQDLLLFKKFFSFCIFSISFSFKVFIKLSLFLIITLKSLI